MKIIDWPDVAEITELTLELRQPGQVALESPYTGRRQVYSRGPGLWEGVVRIAEYHYTSEREVREINLMITRLNGQANATRIPMTTLPTFGIQAAGASEPVSVQGEPVTWRTGSTSTPVEWDTAQLNEGLLIDRLASDDITGEIIYTLNKRFVGDVGMYIRAGDRVLMIVDVLLDGSAIKCVPNVRLDTPTKVLPATHILARLADNQPVAMPAAGGWRGPWALSIIEAIRG